MFDLLKKTLLIMKWNKKYGVGIAAIDAQHKQLFRLNDELEDALKAGMRPEDLDALLVHIGKYAVRHFTLEETHMARVKYPGLTQQQETHKAFVNRFTDIRENFARDGLSREIIDTLHNELIDWIREHITSMDQQFGKYYNRRQ